MIALARDQRGAAHDAVGVSHRGHEASARRAVEGLKIAPLLGAYRGRGALDVDAAVDVIVRLGWLAHELAGSAGRDFEIEVNPLKLRQQGQGAVAVDARARIGQA